MTIRIERREGIAWLWLARPEKHNAFDGAMLLAIDKAIGELAEASDVRVIVIAGEGRSFCAGADLGWMAEQAGAGHEANVASAVRMGEIFHHIASCPKPVVARVHGAALGGGVGLAMAADITIATRRAVFGLTEVRLGLVPGVISPFVVRRVGPSQARALFLTGERVTAADAWRLGMVHWLEEDDDALERRLDVVIAALVAGGPQAQAASKRLVDAVAFQAPADVLELTAEFIATRRESAEAAEGMAAFLLRRRPSWIPGAQDGE